MSTRASKRDQIRVWNDLLRQLHRGGQVLLTKGITSLDLAIQERIVRAIAAFDDFTTDNDPYGEHDCAVLSVEEHCVMFKIDYYDISLTYLSEDPADPKKTARVMTIMLTDEY